MLKGALVWLLEVDADLTHAGGDQKKIGAKLPCQQSGRKVLVDHGLNTLVKTIPDLGHRDSATAGCDDEMPGRNEGLDRIQLQHLRWLGRGDNTAVAASGILNDVPAILVAMLFSFVL